MSHARRSMHSVTRYEPHKTYNGFTLFSPMTEVPGNVWLIDMQGRLVHRWQIPGWIRMHPVLLPNGNILFGLYTGKGAIPESEWVGGDVVEMDWDGNIVWKYADPYMDTHDRFRMKNGNTLIYRYVKVPKRIAAKVKGGVPGTELNGDIWGYAVQEISPEGKAVWEWITYEHLDPELDGIAPLTKYWRWMWPGWNSIVECPDGNIMACSFATSNLLIIDKSTGDIKWRWGQDEISFPHNPSMLDNGNVLVLDNGRYHLNLWPPDYSRVIEVNPSTNEIEWEYREDNPVDFYTTFIGGCQRLPNGNTLVCEGAMGRFFEVTPRGEIVWEYVVPFYAARRVGAIGDIAYGLTNATYRCTRYGPDYPGLQGKKLTTEKLELWNQLYGPDALGSRPKPTIRKEEREAIEEAPSEKKKPGAKYEESKPSVAEPGKGKAVSERAKLLGY